MKNEHVFIFIIVIFMSSCNSESTVEEVQNTDNFYALTVGNFWEYKYYIKDNNTNNFVATTVVETVNISHTVEVNGNIYYYFRYIVEGNNGNYNLLPENGERNYTLRDSLGFLIDQNGGIKYSSNNYDEHIVDDIDGSEDFMSYLKLSEDIVSVTTNAGTFNCVDNNFFYRYSNGTVSNSTDHIYRENAKGEVLGTISFASQNEHFAERRLELFTVQ